MKVLSFQNFIFLIVSHIFNENKIFLGMEKETEWLTLTKYEIINVSDS